jgi:hypothetical protein
MNENKVPQKELLKLELIQELETQIKALDLELKDLREAKSADTKSSAGDKYETGRESLGQTQNLLEAQKSKLLAMYRDLERVPIDAKDLITEGALLKLSMGWVWVAVAFGKITVDREDIQVVSPRAPLVLALKTKKVGASIHLNGKTIQLLGLY